MFSDSDISLLLDVANAACHKGHVADARSIYEGVLAVRPGFAPARLGQALSHAVVNEFAEAERIINEEVLAEAPEDTDAKALLGLTYFLAGRDEEAQDVLRPVAEGDTPAAYVARGLLEGIR